MLLASAWPNATYLGLPVLEKTFGPWARSVAISYDLFACTPLLFTLGVLLARRFGAGGLRQGFLAPLLRVPPLWAALAGLKAEWRLAVMLEAAMPSMIFGIVLADRYGLNTGVYAAALTATTLLSLVTLPLWHAWAG